ncbi:MAG: hypothetical protein AMXMBFR33_67180 [Candidatus Xenobia bacterium]
MLVLDGTNLNSVLLNTTTGVATPVQTLPVVGPAPRDIYSDVVGNLVFVDQAGTQVQPVSVSAGAGLSSLTSIFGFAGGAIMPMAGHNGRLYVYDDAGGTPGLKRFVFDGLTTFNPVGVTFGTTQTTIKSLLLAPPATLTQFSYALDGAGAPTGAVPGAFGPSAVVNMVQHPNGTFLIIASNLDVETVATAGTGAIGATLDTDVYSTVGGANAMALTPNGQFLYVVTDFGPASTDIDVFSVTAGGVMTFVSSVNVGGGYNVNDLAIDPAGRFLLYPTGSALSNGVEFRPIDPTTGALGAATLIALPGPPGWKFCPEVGGGVARPKGGLVWTWGDRLESVDQSDWARLLRASPRPTPFLAPSFLFPWRAAFAPDRPLRIGRYSADGAVRALLFLYDAGLYEELLGGQDVADRLDMLVEPAYEEAAVGAFLQEPREKPVRFPNLAPDACLFRRLGEQAVATRTDSNPVLALPPSFEDYLGGLTKKQRHELRRKMRRAERLGGPLRFVLDQSAGRIDDFLRLHRLSHPEKERFMDQRMEGFFRALLGGWAEEGRLRLALLEGRGQTLAAMLQVAEGRVLHLYNSGFDPEHRELAPGVVLLGMCLQDAIASRYEEYDLLRGTERYKYDLGGQDRSVWRLDLL